MNLSTDSASNSQSSGFCWTTTSSDDEEESPLEEILPQSLLPTESCRDDDSQSGKLTTLASSEGRFSSASSETDTSIESDVFDDIVPNAKMDQSIEDEVEAVVIGIRGKLRFVQTLPHQAKASYYILDDNSECINITNEKGILPGVFVYFYIEELEDLLPDEYIIHDTFDKKKKDKNGKNESSSFGFIGIQKKIKKYRLGETSRDYYILFHQFPLGSDVKRKEKLEQERGCQDQVEDVFDKAIVLVVDEEIAGHPEMIRVVGLNSPKAFMAKSHLKGKRRLRQHTYVKAQCIRSAPFFVLKYLFGTLCLLKSYDEEEKHRQKGIDDEARIANYRSLMLSIYNDEKKAQGLNETNNNTETLEDINNKSLLLKTYRTSSVFDNMYGAMFLFNLQPISKEEEQKISTFCRDVKDLDYETARMCIRDVCLANCRYHCYETARKAAEFTIYKRPRCKIGSEYKIELELDAEQTEKLIKSKVDGVWKIGAELKIVHKDLKRTRIGMKGFQNLNHAYMKIDNIVETKRKTVVILTPSPHSAGVFEPLRFANQKLQGESARIGPEDEDSSMANIALVLWRKFVNLFGQTNLFDAIIGKFENENEEKKRKERIANEKKELSSSGQIGTYRAPLDHSQRHALLEALSSNIVTITEAPPGTGKTHLIKTLTANWKHLHPDARSVLTATTNNAINNAVERLVELFPEFHIVREMSKQGEEKVSELLQKYTLSYRCEQPLKEQELIGCHTAETLAKAVFEYKSVKAKYEDTSLGVQDRMNLYEMIHDTHSILKRTWKEAAVPYASASTPAILSRHADHGVVSYRIVGWTTRVSGDIKHLIVDEASQLPCYVAFALYCTYPDLIKINIIGDSKQLGPHTLLDDNRESLFHKMMHLSELDRLKALETTTTTYLMHNYRSHPAIVNLQSHIYGLNLSAALKASQRTLAYKKSLPYTRHDCPVAFLHVKGIEENGHNVQEKNAVINLLRLLLNNENPNNRIGRKNVVVLCFHKRQRLEIEKHINKYLPDYSEIKEEIVCATIDSFQGKEADIIILATTKTCDDFCDAKQKLKFVSNFNRCTVAVSRARECAYFVGNWDMLRGTPFWSNYKTDYIERGFLHEVSSVLTITEAVTPLQTSMVSSPLIDTDFPALC